MGLRTGGVRKAKVNIQGLPKNLMNVDLNQINAQIGQNAVLSGERSNSSINLTPNPIVQDFYPDDQVIRPDLIEGDDVPFIGNRTPGLGTPEFAPTPPTTKYASAATAKAYRDEQLRLQEVGAAADIASGVMKGLGGVINAQSKYSQTVNRNNFNIQLAEMQSLNIAADSAGRQLKEQTKGKSRGQDAQLSAVAQGQSASGDLALTAMSNEDVYAAENMMNIELNSMRQIFGLESQKRMFESNSRVAKINRDLEMAQAIVEGGTQVGMGIAGLPGRS